MYKWVSQVCPICEVPPAKFLGRRGGEAHREHLGVECDIWRCDTCRLIFPNPMPIPISGLDQHYRIVPDAYFRQHDLNEKGIVASYMLQQAQTITGGKGTLLDIGAGRGELLKLARQEGWNAIGIEPSTTFAEYAACYSGAAIKPEPVEHCGFKESFFDAVILSAVLEHLYNPDETIKEISRILRVGGALYIDVPNEEGIYFRVGNLYQKLKRRNWVVNLSPTFSPFHVFGFSSKSLRALLTKHNFKPETWQVYGGRSSVPAHGGLTSILERQAARIVTSISNLGNLGTYISAWAVKVASADRKC